MGPLSDTLTLSETSNIVRNKSVEHLHIKWVPSDIERIETDRRTRSKTRGDLKVPKKPKESCLGFSWNAPKLWNMLPTHIRETTVPNIFKSQVKKWIWDGNVPV